MCIGSYADISVHAPTRGATSNSLSFSIFSVFQSTLPREERLLGLNFKEANSIFQSTLPREERLLQQYLSHFQLLFQSTLPREERRAKRTCLPKEPSDFNPRSHERSDLPYLQTWYLLRFISIHAPTRGATIHTIHLSQAHMISIHAPTRGATCADAYSTDPISDFNPRSHERSDVVITLLTTSISISIHAPTRGATAILHKKFVYFYTIPTINI